MTISAPCLALVPGEPAGIGPELCVQLVQTPAPGYRLLAFADPGTLMRAAQTLGLPLRLLPPDARAQIPGDLPLQPVPLPGSPPAFGEPDPANAAAVVASLQAAAQSCLDGRCHGLMTGPTHKASINQGGIAYTGTTELLATLTGCEVAMMLARPDLRVVLVTTHLPLREVADAITEESLSRILRITDSALRHDFAIAEPRIAVLGLNPHAGEAGHLGREEIDLIIPVLDALRGEGLQLIGPLPADTAFLPQKLPGFDAVVAMYHDQGLPVLKSTGLEQAVNITLGLPFPRVAVDHGVALDIAGRGIADVSSLAAAARQCAALAAHRMS
ncbi:4-hydroxythreonine-4-phosphate dehydrogenase PdxA [Lysobacteraceae bacterium NML71-0210]|nr:4-hydroxythreonine-4-phosphate dehydrogenase PdxA [Xanthomonadaceae bacterium NML71-0210]